MELRNIKGASDFSPAEMIIRNKVVDTLRNNFELYGYQPIDTPMLNYRELLTYKYTDSAEIVKEIYNLSDQGERDLGLRFDLTVPFCKYISLNRGMKLPFKRYEIGKVFRNGPVKSGRLREFIQCDIDVVGDKSRNIEAELIELAIKAYTELGINVIIEIGNRKLLLSLIKFIGATKHFDEIIGIIDKVKKVEPSQTLTSLKKYLTVEQAEMLIKYINLDLTALEKILGDNEGITQTKELFAMLSKLGLASFCKFTPSLARGLNVYTGAVWEVFDASGIYTSSLGGGGRYDDIITNFLSNGVDYPAVGMSFGLEPISALLGKKEASNPIKLLIMPMNTEEQSTLLAHKLRSNQISVMKWTANAKVGKALEYANATKINFVTVVGENEINTNTIQIKNMISSEQKQFSLDDIPAIINHIK